MSKRRSATQQQSVHPPEMQRFLEWQEKQYLPGYYTGGRIPPIFFGKRPNKFGYLLMLTGSVTLVMVLFAVWSYFTAASNPDGGQPLLIAGTIGILQLVAGWRLLQAPKITQKRR